jgi:hypothetical protein
MSVKGHASAKRDLRETTAKRGTMTSLQMVRREASCLCCSDLLNGKFDRRLFVRAVAIGGATLAIAPYLALAAEGNYEAMVLSCIDPRMQEPVHKYTVDQNLTGKFSQFVIAGASIGVVAPAFKDWHQAFWDNLGTSIQLHHIKKVSQSTIAIAALPGSLMARRRWQTRKWRPKRTKLRSRSSASKSGNATRSSAWKPA